MTDPGSGVLGSTAAEADMTPEPGPSPPPFEPQSEDPTGRSAAFDACVKDIRRWYGSNAPDLFPSLEDLIRRRLGVAPMTAAAGALAGLTGAGIRLAVVLLATVLAGQWTGIPWGRWAAIFAFYCVLDGSNTTMAPPPDISVEPRWRRVVENWTALVPAIVRESDLQDLAAFTRRWYRLPVVAAAGMAVAAIMLGACVLFTPAALSELPAGSIVLLAFLLYDFGATPIYWGVLFNWAFMAREARYDHHLFWPSPADSPEIQQAIRKTTIQGSLAGMWITIFLVLTVVLVSWDSPLVLPLGVGFIMIGYLATIGAAFGNRASVRKIVERIRSERLAVLRHRIDAFGPRFADLSSPESEQLRDLLTLHNTIRDAPTTPTTTHTAMRALVGLVIPTVMFVIAVFGEVYAERILDALLP